MALAWKKMTKLLLREIRMAQFHADEFHQPNSWRGDRLKGDHSLGVHHIVESMWECITDKNAKIHRLERDILHLQAMLDQERKERGGTDAQPRGP